MIQSLPASNVQTNVESVPEVRLGPNSNVTSQQPPRSVLDPIQATQTIEARVEMATKQEDEDGETDDLVPEMFQESRALFNKKPDASRKFKKLQLFIQYDDDKNIQQE